MGKDLGRKKSGSFGLPGNPNKKIGVLLEIRCETDFVAKSPEFQELAHEVAMQIAAMKPVFVKEEDIPEESLAEEKRIYAEQTAGSGKPENIVNQIIEGKLKKYKAQVSLLSQPWIKDDSKNIKALISDYIGKIGENIEVKRFTVFEI